MININQEKAIKYIIIIFVIIAVSFCVGAAVLMNIYSNEVDYDSRESNYYQALSYIDNGEYNSALIMLSKCGDYLNSQDLYDEIYIMVATTYDASIGIGAFGDIYYIDSDGNLMVKSKQGLNFDVDWTDVNTIYASQNTPVLSAVMNGDNGIVYENQFYIYEYDNVVKAYGDINVRCFIMSDGTVECIANKNSVKNTVSSWDNIIDISIGGTVNSTFGGSYPLIVGLKTDGTVVLWGDSTLEKKVNEWTDIVKVVAGEYAVIGIKADGTVEYVARGEDQESIHEWTDIVDVSFGKYVKFSSARTSIFDKHANYYNYVVGLKADGTLVESFNCYGDNLSVFQDVVDFDVSYYDIVCVSSDGSVTYSDILNINNDKIVTENWNVMVR